MKKRLRGYLNTAICVGGSCLMLMMLSPAIHTYMDAVGLTRVKAAEPESLAVSLSETILERFSLVSGRYQNVTARARALASSGSSVSGIDDHAVEDVFVTEADAEGDGTGAEGTAEDSWQAVEEPTWVYYGTFTATAYCGCPECCGSYSSGYTASGTLATEGRTIACNCLPIGTEVLINDHTYVVEDTGYTPYGDAWLDIYFESHDEALAFGVKAVDVYVFE